MPDDPHAGRPSDLLVIGYGNTLRQDDGVGPRVAVRIAALDLPGVSTLACAQLSPEHTEPVASSRATIFVDASVGGATTVELKEVLPAESSQVTTHAAEPATILALARDVFGHAPPAWCLTIPAVKLGFGEDISPEAERGMETAIQHIVRLSRSLRISDPVALETQRARQR